MNLKLGSLFDGSGTAPLAASMCGIEPVWASEIEPYPIKVTTARFPNMKHLGSITEMDGAKIEPVDIICGGSPCQDLSVAGKQAGLHNGERSHLFFEMTRIIKEMRGATNGKYPRYVIWENVPGAFSSNKGEDFLAVLQAFAEIADADVHVPRPESRGGRLGWKYAGEMVGNGWSIAWRTVDAQYWGVPQRRRRIYLVADFAGECADEILFERTGMSGHSEPSGEKRKEIARETEDSFGADDREGVYGWPLGFPAENTRLYKETSTTLCNGTRPGHTCGVIEVLEGRPVYCLQGNGIDRADTAGCNGKGWKEDVGYTLNTIDRHAIAYAIGNGQVNQISMTEVGNTLDCMHDKQAVLIDNDVCRVTVGALCARDYKGVGAQYVYEGKCVVQNDSVSIKDKHYTVRRLTPLECCRLQGFPDWWEDGVEGSDSARYKMWGNGMALPNMLFVMRNIAEREALNDHQQEEV